MKVELKYFRFDARQVRFLISRDCGWHCDDEPMQDAASLIRKGIRESNEGILLCKGYIYDSGWKTADKS